MKHYIAIIVLSILAASASLSAQNVDVKVGGDQNYDDVVRDYIRVGRIQTGKLNDSRRGNRSSEDVPFEKIGLSLGISSLGIGFNVSTPINESWKIRVGGDYLPPLFSINRKIAIKDDALKARLQGDYYPDYDVDLSPNFFNGHVLASFYPMREIPFHITGGIYLGINKVQGEGHLINPADGNQSTLKNPNDLWPKLNVEGYALDIEDGVLNADVKVGSVIKPYLGVGYGYVVPNSDWSFNVDLGVLYQGGFSIHQFGEEAPDFIYSNESAEGHTSSAIHLKDDYINKVKFWPVLGIQVLYRIH